MASTKTLTGSVQASVNYTYTNTDDDSGWATKESQVVKQASNYTSGDGANKVEQVYRERFTVTSGSPNKDFDLFGALTDVFGGTINLERVRLILLRNLATAAGDDVYIGPLGASNPFLEPWVDADGNNRVPPGGALLLDAPADGFNVEATSQTVRVQYQGASGSISCEFVVMGSSGSLESSSSSSVSLSSGSSSSQSSLEGKSTSSSSSSSASSISSQG